MVDSFVFYYFIVVQFIYPLVRWIIGLIRSQTENRVSPMVMIGSVNNVVNSSTFLHMNRFNETISVSIVSLMYCLLPYDLPSGFILSSL